MDNMSIPGTQLFLTDSVAIGGTASVIGSQWKKTNFREGATIEAAIGSGNSIWTEVPGAAQALSGWCSYRRAALAMADEPAH